MKPDRLRQAAAALRENATVLRDSSTFGGVWPIVIDGNDVSTLHAKEDHDEWNTLADELDWAATVEQHHPRPWPPGVGYAYDRAVIRDEEGTVLISAGGPTVRPPLRPSPTLEDCGVHVPLPLTIIFATLVGLIAFACGFAVGRL